jgi:Trk K+ transport system NAD-binding subunit
MGVSPLGEQNSNRSRRQFSPRDRFEIENVAAEVDDHDRVVEFAEHGIKTIGTSMAVAASLDNLVEKPDLFTMLATPHGESDSVQVTVTSRDASRTQTA